jgi:membrane associated rhomboid family serine protease
MELSVTLAIILVTAIVSIPAFQNAVLFDRLLMRPFAVRHEEQWYRLLTHAFVHADWGHLAVNMFVLYMFGRNVEVLFMYITALPMVVMYIALYIGGILFASIPGMVKHADDPGYRAVGASGAVSAVLFSQILILPTQPVSILFIPVELPAFLFGGLYLIYSWYMDKRGGDHVAHDAHFYGALFGVLFTTMLDPALLFRFGSFERSMGL